MTIAEVWVSVASFQKPALSIFRIQTLSLPLHLEHCIAIPKTTSAAHSNHMNRVSPKKLLLSKWTAVQPIAKQKHFLVSKVILPEDPLQAIELIEIEAVYSKQTKTIAWRDLLNSDHWIQGWK